MGLFSRISGYNPVELCNRVDFISEIYEIFGIEHGENMFDNGLDRTQIITSEKLLIKLV